MPLLYHKHIVISICIYYTAHMEIITRAKKACTAHEKPCPQKPGRGRPPKKGAAVMHYLRKHFFRLLGKQP